MIQHVFWRVYRIGWDCVFSHQSQGITNAKSRTFAPGMAPGRRVRKMHIHFYIFSPLSFILCFAAPRIPRSCCLITTFHFWVKFLPLELFKSCSKELALILELCILIWQQTILYIITRSCIILFVKITTSISSKFQISLLCVFDQNSTCIYEHRKRTDL